MNVLEDNKWILGYIINIREAMRPEYDVQLMTDGSIVSHTIQTMKEGGLDLGEEDAFDPVLPPVVLSVERLHTRLNGLDV